MNLIQWVFKTFHSQLSAVVLGQIRTLSAVVGGSLVTHGVAAGYSSEQITGALCCLGAVAFSAVDKFVVGYKITTAAETGAVTPATPTLAVQS